jgi:acetyl esterase/lipase
MPRKHRIILEIRMKLPFTVLCAGLAAVLSSSLAVASQPIQIIDLWPGTAPGDTGDIGPERDMTKPTDGLVGGKRVIRLGNVNRPTIALYPPVPEKNTGTTVVVCPGGGYSILAMDLEGTEVCHWLNSIGVTAALLKYRVPARAGRPRYAAALQDVQRAMGIVRSRAAEWGINPTRIGVLGFSAGGDLGALVSNDYEKRTYPTVDAADETSCRPDFAILIYPAYLAVKNKPGKLAPEIKVTEHTPPTFLVQAEDDPVGMENAIYYALALHKAHVSCELHIYPKGGHGYGLRPSKNLVTTWPLRATDWLRQAGLLDPSTSPGS